MRTAFDLVRYIRSLLGNGETDLYRRVQTEMDRVLPREVLAHVHDNQVQASELLGISRTTLRSKLTQLGSLMRRTCCECVKFYFA